MISLDEGVLWNILKQVCYAYVLLLAPSIVQIVAYFPEISKFITWA